MKIDVIMPKMGESLQEGTILKWLKAEGDSVERDEMILEISTDKVDTEVPAPSAGVLSKILAQENEVVEVGKVIAEIETDASASVTPTPAPASPKEEAKEVVSSSPAPAKAEEVPTGDLVDVVMPKMGESLQEGTILKWLKAPGDNIERDEMILEISTDKVDTEVPSPVAGTLAEQLAAEGDTVEVGTVIAKISTGGSASAKAGTSQSGTYEAKAPVQMPQADSAPMAPVKVASGSTEIPRTDGKNFYSPLVRAIAEAEGIALNELQTLNGSGADGRLTKNDILEYLKSRNKSGKVSDAPVAPTTQQSPSQKSAPTVPVASGPDTEIIPMDRVRRLIADHMTYSKQTSAHVTSVAECDVTDLVRFREKNKAAFQSREGIKLTYTPIFAKAIVDTIRDFPRINVSVDGNNIIQHKRTHLSFATALDNGNLIVPVIKQADALSISGLARAVNDLAFRARNKKLNPDDIQGGTITLTNVGTFGTMFGTPVINQPQCAIIGVGAIKKQPVVREFDGEDVIVIRHIMYVSITYDHRVIDGMLAGQALSRLVSHLEEINENNISL